MLHFARLFGVVLTMMVLTAGCTNTDGAGGPSLAEEGWTRVGEVTAYADQDRAVLRADSLPGRYQSICIETDAAVLIERLGASFNDTTTFQTTEQIAIAGPERRVIEMSGGQRQFIHIMMVHSGGRPKLGTKVTVWVR